MPTNRALTLVALAFTAFLLTAVSACGASPGAHTSSAGPAGNGPTWTVVSQSIDAVLATPDLGPGERRLAFTLSDERGLIRFPIVPLRSYFYPGGYEGGQPDGVEETLARFHEFPLGLRGIHTAYLTLGRAGDWAVRASIPRPNGSVETVEIRFKVSERTASVDIGEVPPAVQTRTLPEVESIAELTTGSLHDPALYKLSLHEAMTSGTPTVVAFASPAFCTNAICGPQDEVLSELNTVYGGRVNFVHIDLYENPHEILGDISRGRLSPVLAEWGLVSQEWTFVLDETGRISARFENFAPKEELVPEVEKVLASS